MRVLFTIGDTFFPQRSGGVQSSTDQLARALISEGHDVAVACALGTVGWTKWRSRLQRAAGRTHFSRDVFKGYPVYRSWHPSNLDEVVWRFKPDVAIVQNGLTVPMLASLRAQNIPCLVYFRNVEFDELCGDLTQTSGNRYIANSKSTAGRVKEKFGFDCDVIPPLVDPDLYLTVTHRSNITFINPSPIKGLDIALEIAKRCPDIPFSFVENWELKKEDRDDLERQIFPLGNVILRPRTDNMKEVYGRAKILLAPSRWEEAWGRVATEAHINGIPVIGSQQGGLPEAIGPGGITIPIDAEIDEWVGAIQLLWYDAISYAKLSAQALAFSKRPEMRTDFQTRQLLTTIQRHLRS